MTRTSSRAFETGVAADRAGVRRTSARWWRNRPIRSIEWKKVFKRQDYANMLLTAGIIIAVATISGVATPTHRTWYITDPSISYIAKPNTIPSWVAVLVPLVCLAITVAVGELIYSRRQHKSATDAAATALHFFLDGVQSFVCGLLLTQVFKVSVGRLRPGFLNICNPIVPPNTAVPSVQYNAGQGSAFPCADNDSDARKSFPSGHSSTCFNLSVYACAYLIWAFHYRRPWFPREMSFREEFKEDLKNVAAKFWMLLMLCFSWGVAVSRVIDYKHNVSDIIAGILLGTMIALVYVLRAIPRYRRVLSPEVAAGDVAPTAAVGAYGDPYSGANATGGAVTSCDPGTSMGAWGAGKAVATQGGGFAGVNGSPRPAELSGGSEAPLQSNMV